MKDVWCYLLLMVLSCLLLIVSLILFTSRSIFYVTRLTQLKLTTYTAKLSMMVMKRNVSTQDTDIKLYEIKKNMNEDKYNSLLDEIQ